MWLHSFFTPGRPPKQQTLANPCFFASAGAQNHFLITPGVSSLTKMRMSQRKRIFSRQMSDSYSSFAHRAHVTLGGGTPQYKMKETLRTSSILLMAGPTAQLSSPGPCKRRCRFTTNPCLCKSITAREHIF